MKSTFTLHLLCLLLLLGLTTHTALAQTGFFQPINTSQMRAAAAAKLSTVQKARLFRIPQQPLRDYLKAAPLRNTNAQPIPLTIPLPDGTTETFLIHEAPLLAPNIAAQHPDIKTYAGTGQLNPNHSIRLSFTASGFNAIILGLPQDNVVYFDKLAADPADVTYMTYFARDAKLDKTHPRAGSHCGTLDTPTSLPANPARGRKAAAGVQSGEVLRTFRLALAANGEFTQGNGGTPAAAFDVLVAYVSRMNAVFKEELSVEFTLVSGTNLIYTDPATDPYANDGSPMMLDQNQTTVDAIIGTASYDVAHVLGYDATVSPGGIAQRPSVCDPLNKAKGATVEGQHGTYSQLFQDQVLFHEVGHQFNMSHSYNSNLAACNTRTQETSVEPGAGVTLMSYGFICFEQFPSTNSDDYFPSTTVGLLLHYHSVNYEQAINFLETVSCNTSAPTNNAAPVVTVPAGFTIPKSTPFTLTGSATDANSDPLTYSWEGTNVGDVTPPDASVLTDASKPPFFRSYEPVSTPVRTYPLVSSILDGSNTARADKLPSVGIETTHRLTARDGKGGVSYGVVSVTIDGASGPFLETTNLSGSYPGNSPQTITWSVNNTTAPPVSCANVDLLLSTDGGLTFPTVLVAGTPNDGSQAVILPAVLTSTARIKVAASSNIFFDISNTDFAITAPASCQCLDIVVTIK